MKAANSLVGDAGEAVLENIDTAQIQESDVDDIFIDPSEEYLSEDGNYFTGSFMAVFLSPAEILQSFGSESESIHVDRRTVEHLINQRMCPPPFPLGMTFDQVSIYEPIEHALICGQILDCTHSLNERICVLLEDGDYHEIWFHIHFDPWIVLRHIPTLTTEDGEALFHTQHLWQFAEAILPNPRNALIFGSVPSHVSPYLQNLIDEVSAADSTPRSEIQGLGD